MKKLTLAALLLFCCCHEQTAPVQSTASPMDTVPIAALADSTANDTIARIINFNFLDTLVGDFNGDGHPEMAFTVLKEDTVIDGTDTSFEQTYEVHFSDSTLPSFNFDCCEAQFVREGDLNDDGVEDFSLFQAPLSSNVYRFSTYTFKNKKWELVLDPFYVPTGGDKEVTNRDLRNEVFLENDTLYFQNANLDDENWSITKTVAKPPSHP